MILVEQGKIGLDDPLTKYFAGAPASWKDVTVRELLSWAYSNLGYVTLGILIHRATGEFYGDLRVFSMNRSSSFVRYIRTVALPRRLRRRNRFSSAWRKGRCGLRCATVPCWGRPLLW